MDWMKICRRLKIRDFDNVEIESKMRVLPEEAERLRDYLLDRKRLKFLKRRTFFDQFLDTPGLDLLKSRASLRLRYKGDGTQVYLQYKGPGFLKDGLLYRSEFSSQRLEHVVLEESHHDVVHFTQTSVRDILATHVSHAMAEAMRKHLGERIIRSITSGPILASYQKEKFHVDLGSAWLEPSLDRLLAFHINRKGMHSLSMFWEYENEIKSDHDDPLAKLDHLGELRRFDREVARKFHLAPERLDKYNRCASCFVSLRRPRT